MDRGGIAERGLRTAREEVIAGGDCIVAREVVIPGRCSGDGSIKPFSTTAGPRSCNLRRHWPLGSEQYQVDTAPHNDAASFRLSSSSWLSLGHKSSSSSTSTRSPSTTSACTPPSESVASGQVNELTNDRSLARCRSSHGPGRSAREN